MPTTTPITTLITLALLLAAGPAGAQTEPPATAPTPESAPSPAPSGAAAASPPASTPETTATTPPATVTPPEGTKRVTYVSETVRAQLREEVIQELTERMKKERWAQPDLVPAWVARLKVTMDVRTRFERVMFGKGNAKEAFDFAGINANKPLDASFVAATPNDRYLNVDQDRNRPRLRARLGIDADLGDGWGAGLRVATGDGSSPVSTNQTLGGSPGNFSKYQLWVDRASLHYRWTRFGGGAIRAGRFGNPFLATELIWSDNVNLDGLALEAHLPGLGSLRPFLTGGAFPLYTSPLDLAADHDAKFKSLDRWLYAAQLGVDWRPGPKLAIKLGGAFYDFDRIEGQTSAPCHTHLADQNCDTDASRPPFAQKGNTYRDLRTPSDLALSYPAGTVPNYQYFGLSSLFREVALTARAELTASANLRLVADGEVVENRGFHRGAIAPSARNNYGPCRAYDDMGACTDESYEGGNLGYLARLSVGSPALDHRWAWNAAVSYRHVESDGVVDAFNDSDFGLGGTNLKGFTAAATLSLGERVSATARWLSADQIIGAPYRVDVLQVDLQGRY